MKTGKLRKGKYEVEDLLHERIKKRKKTNTNIISMTDTQKTHSNIHRFVS